MPDTHDLLCAVCSGLAGRVGALTDRGDVEAVACRNAACVDIITRTLRAPPDPYHAAALAAGGKAGGEYLMSVGVTDVRTLTREQYAQFVFEIVAVWRASLAAEAASRAEGLSHG